MQNSVEFTKLASQSGMHIYIEVKIYMEKNKLTNGDVIYTPCPLLHFKFSRAYWKVNRLLLSPLPIVHHFECRHAM